MYLTTKRMSEFGGEDVKLESIVDWAPTTATHPSL